MSPCFAFVLYSGVIRHAHWWSCLPLLTRKGGDYKKREKGIHSVAAKEKGSRHVLWCLGLENRVIFQISMLGILMPYLYKFQVLLENQSIQGLQQCSLLVCVLSFPATTPCHLCTLLECRECCLLRGYLDTGHGGMEGRAEQLRQPAVEPCLDFWKCLCQGAF